MSYLYIGQRVRAHVEPNHGGIDYGVGEIISMRPGVNESALVRFLDGKVGRFNTRWLTPVWEDKQ